MDIHTRRGLTHRGVEFQAGRGTRPQAVLFNRLYLVTLTSPLDPLIILTFLMDNDVVVTGGHKV